MCRGVIGTLSQRPDHGRFIRRRRYTSIEIDRCGITGTTGQRWVIRHIWQLIDDGAIECWTGTDVFNYNGIRYRCSEVHRTRRAAFIYGQVRLDHGHHRRSITRAIRYRSVVAVDLVEGITRGITECQRCNIRWITVS